MGAVLSPPLAGHPLRPATRHRLGRPLPHQLPDRTRAPPPAAKAFHLRPKARRSYAGLSSVSRGYTPPEGRLLTRYSAVCRFTIVAEATITLDLHALSAPPAFTLSQDQTLLLRTLLPSTIQLLNCPLPRRRPCAIYGGQVRTRYTPPRPLSIPKTPKTPKIQNSAAFPPTRPQPSSPPPPRSPLRLAPAAYPVPDCQPAPARLPHPGSPIPESPILCNCPAAANSPRDDNSGGLCYYLCPTFTTGSVCLACSKSPPTIH